MSDEGEDPFEEFEEEVEDREGDPFERLDDVDAEEEKPDDLDEPPVSGPGDTNQAGEGGPEHGGAGDQTGGYDAHDVTPEDHRDEIDEPADSQGGPPGDIDTTGGTDPTGESDPTGDSDTTGGTDPQGEATEPSFEGTGFEYREEPGVRRGQGDDPAAGHQGTPDDRLGDPFEEGGVFEEMEVEDLDPDRVWEQLTDAEARGSVSAMQERTYAEVSKHSYCEQCEFFSAPPEVACSHEGTEIVEFVDMETVRVVDCPVVAERKELEQE